MRNIKGESLSGNRLETREGRGGGGGEGTQTKQVMKRGNH